MTAFETTRPLRFGDCDPSGIAYFPSYMNMLVGVTEDLFASIGWPWPRLASERNITTPTVRLDVTFTRPGFEGDALTWRCTVAGIGRTSLDLLHEVAAAEPLWRAEQRLVATTLETHRPVSWPDDLRSALELYHG
jgi:4-hydroxybenzoyl-CoA thioesterase